MNIGPDILVGNLLTLDKIAHGGYYLRRMEKAMFSSLYVCLFVCLFVCLLATLRENARKDFYEICRRSDLGHGAIWNI